MTVRELIEELNEIENKDKPVVLVTFPDGTPSEIELYDYPSQLVLEQ